MENELKQFGINPEKYCEFYYPALKNNPHREKPEFIWNHFYINRNILIDKQYRRVLEIDKNYSYDNFTTDLKEYNDYVNESVLPKEKDVALKKYFTMSMDYYFLETYKRIDFIFKYVTTMLEVGVSRIDLNSWIVNRFITDVLVPYEDNGEIRFNVTKKYYRPPIYIGDRFLETICMSGKYDQILYETLFYKYQLVRAKAYELFNCHFRYVSNDYEEINKFTCKHFNMIHYHNSNEIWKTLRNFKEMEDEEKRSFKKFPKILWL